MPPFAHYKARLERYWPVASLRTYLVAVILLATLPLAALMSFQIYMEVRGEQAQIEDNLGRTATALAAAVESELIASLDALTVLSHAEVLRQSEPAGLEPLLLGRPRPRRDWHSVFLLDGDGTVLVDTAGPTGVQAPQSLLRELHQRVRERVQPAVSGLVAAVPGENAAVMLGVPVVQERQARYVLGARVAADVWQRLARSAGQPEGGYALVHDAQHRLISYTLASQVPAGAQLPADAVEGMRGRPSGVQRSSGIDGRTVYAAWRSVPLAGWGVQVAVPAAPIDAAHRQAILAALAASGSSLLLGVGLAALAARRISRPLHHLATQGAAGWRGRVAVREIAMLRDALRLAAHQDQAARQGLEQKAAELQTAGERLRESHRLMELAQEAGHVGFFQYRFATDELVWTPGHCKLFGVDAPLGTLSDWFARIDEADRARVEREFWTACALRRETETLEYCAMRGDGSARWLSSRVLLQYDGEGAAAQATGVTMDMSDHREAEMQRAELTRQALAAREQAEASSRAKDEFLTMLSHELRNPLGAISAAVDVLEAAPPGSQSAAEARGIIARQTRNMAHMMNDLLDVGRVLAGKILLARQPVDLAAVLDRVCRTLQVTGESAAHELHVQAGQAWVEGDAVRLEQVVSNLVANAIKYTPAGRRIEVTLERKDGHAVFEVKDAGMGIPATLLPHIFDLFVQGERPLDRRAGGLGIGLTLVRRLVELHGGTIAAESSHAGSRFTVRITAIEPPVRLGGDTLPPSRRRKVLVIEDNADVLAALRSKLELDGHTVSTAEDGIDGLQRLLRQQPEVSIVDIGLPGLTGYELARHARAAGYAGRMIAISGYGAERDVNNALVAGFDAYLVKPVDRSQLRASLSAD
ncbi:MAG TPA: ATP-binding protein [Aquabacterium sp.]|nr:ATP-binding protein [Aquabacterium sp.]